ncbi:MAG: ATP-binding protein [Nocardioidaceae bacterium]
MAPREETVRLDDLPDGVLVADQDGSVIGANAAVAGILGGTAERILGRHLRDVLSVDDLEGHRWYDCSNPYDGLVTRTRIAEQSWHLPDGRELLITARLIRDRPRGFVEQVVVSIREARVRARHDRDRSDLVATVAHELRSPLTGVKGFVATLLGKWERFTDSQRLLMLETVDSDADRLGRLITELLDAARIDSGRLAIRTEPLDLAKVVQKVLDNIAAGSGRALQVAAAGPLPTVWGDDIRVGQVVTNIVENALRHGDGAVSVGLAAEVQGGVQGVTLLVDDEGEGVPEEIRSRVFTRFWKSGPRGGSGLGLYVVRGVVAAHGGQVSIDDAPGGGARVRVWLPCSEPDGLSD